MTAQTEPAEKALIRRVSTHPRKALTDMRFDYYDDLIFFNGSSWDRYFPAYADEQTLYDVIVIGSGMGGGILGNTTSNRGKKTLILEAGPIRHLVNVTDLPLPNVAETIQPYELADGTVLQGGLCFNLGGRSIFWSAVIPQMSDWELHHWPDEIATFLREPKSGYAEAEVLFRKRSEYPKFQRKLVKAFGNEFQDFEVTALPRSLDQPDSKYNPLPGSPDARSTGVFSTAALLANSLNFPGLAGSEYLNVAVQHLADRLVLDGNKAVGVEVLDLRNHCRRTFRGKRIVLACGTTESARLALTSGLTSPGYGTDGKLVDNLIGRGLADHPDAQLQFDIPEHWGFGNREFTSNDQGNIFLRPHEPSVQYRFSCELALNYKFWDVRFEDDQLYRQQVGGHAPSRSTIKFLFRNGLCEENFVEANPRYLVGLKPMTDPAALTGAKELASRIFEYFRVDPARAAELKVDPGSLTPHLAGSMRMGVDPASSVVDTHLKFHRYENLYCSDLSVFPDIPASNPSLTLGALALRLARDLADGL